MACLVFLRSSVDAVCRTVRATAESLSGLLLGTEEDAVMNRDPIMEVVSQNPQEAIRFIKLVMLFGATTGVLVSVPCIIYLVLYWDECKCNKPLQWWVLVFSALQVSQVPVRYLFFFHLHAAPDNRLAIINTTRTLTGGRGWKCSKFVSILSYGWFILGVVWVFNTHECAEAPGLWKLTVSAIVISMLRLVTTFVCFWISFPPNAGGVQNTDRLRRAATPEQIAKLPLLTYAEKKAQLRVRARQNKNALGGVEKEAPPTEKGRNACGETSAKQGLNSHQGAERSGGNNERNEQNQTHGEAKTGDPERGEVLRSLTAAAKDERRSETGLSQGRGSTEIRARLACSLQDSEHRPSQMPLSASRSSSSRLRHSSSPTSISRTSSCPVGASESPSVGFSSSFSRFPVPSVRGGGAEQGLSPLSPFTRKVDTATSLAAQQLPDTLRQPSSEAASRARDAAPLQSSMEISEERKPANGAGGAANLPVPLQDFSAAGAGAEFSSVQENCCICLGEFVDEEVIRELHCSHFFHQPCIDKWLLKNKQCPLCLRSIDENFTSGTKAAETGRVS
ncbi:zinc finger, C3HC4 type (RING finger) domain-containing protein [Besnoitia besnoiti]|uniref:Zinc finger, C3HC4 type (RING finger) domain-containing protein n=1 Tax=Besnoitia besnoiti TaxID=94643 RepID=A0A2A9MJ35_BESBE|nr:zinc finger, C3HC4 type (RING finger) domain-containing protein [Besnoitia besnoiti]PFH37204.1 zinc finger, C3HC4 type (RING finger) domain-containing protein [Besnoitia besnoiti]